MPSLNRREFIKHTATGLAAGAAGLNLIQQMAMGANSGSPQRPNIVFILTDDQRFDAMSCAGHPFLKTPNLDRIRNEGALFSNAFVTTSLCSPSRASFLTGTYAHTHGVMLNALNDFDPDQTPSFPQILRDQAGYKTAFIGKWHLDSHNDAPREGFDTWLSFKGQGEYFNPQLNENGRNFKAEGYITDILSDYAADTIKRYASGGQPFCLYLSHKAVHSPFKPAPRHEGVYKDEVIDEPATYSEDRADKPAWRRLPGNRKWRSSETPEPIAQRKAKPWQPRRYHKNMMECILSVDEGVGKILDTLEQTGQLDNTIVVFAGDNGYFLGEHGLGDKRLAYEESMRIPLIMRYPKAIPAGATIDQMVLNIDMAPTLLALAGVKAPKIMQGRSAAELLAGKNNRWRKSFLYEYWRDLTPGVPRTVAVRTDRWKLIRFPDIDDIDELYDLKNDPHEQTNLSQKPEHAGQIKTLRAELDRLMRETGYVAQPTIGKSTKPAGLVMALECGQTADGRSPDSSGNGNHGRVHGATLVTDQGRSALKFDGDSYVNVRSSGSLDPRLCPWTVEAWIKPAGDGVIAAHGGGNNNGGYILFVENGVPAFGVHTNYAILIADARQSCIEKWTHVVGVFRAHHADIYVNGEKIDSIRTLHELHRMPWGDLTIGADPKPQVFEEISNISYKGLIESVRMYRQEMSDADVRRMYEKTRVRP